MIIELPAVEQNVFPADVFNMDWNSNCFDVFIGVVGKRGKLILRIKLYYAKQLTFRKAHDEYSRLLLKRSCNFKD